MPLDQPETPTGQFKFDLSGSSIDHRFLAVMQEVAARFERLDRVASRIETIAEDVAHLKQELRYRRRDLRGATKRQHVADIRLMGGKCPCCGSANVLDADGQRSSEAEFDHYYASSHPDAEHTWLICRPCHLGLTTGRVPRDQREAEFRAYQSKRRRLTSAAGRLV
jgi:hypothetical protein